MKTALPGYGVITAAFPTGTAEVMAVLEEVKVR
jgi:hypothetical protein